MPTRTEDQDNDEINVELNVEGNEERQGVLVGNRYSSTPLQEHDNALFRIPARVVITTSRFIRMNFVVLCSIILFISILAGFILSSSMRRTIATSFAPYRAGGPDEGAIGYAFEHMFARL